MWKHVQLFFWLCSWSLKMATAAPPPTLRPPPSLPTHRESKTSCIHACGGPSPWTWQKRSCSDFWDLTHRKPGSFHLSLLESLQGKLPNCPKGPSYEKVLTSHMGRQPGRGGCQWAPSTKHAACEEPSQMHRPANKHPRESSANTTWQ